jgi:hypothetical protein
MEATYAYEVDGRPRATMYEFEDHFEKWIGGSPAWRNNNPGNLRPARAHKGQIGEAFGFAVFPDEETGKQAMVEQLKRPLYSGLTLRQAIYVYAPPSENPTEKYLAYVVKKSGISEKAILLTLTDADLMKIVNAMVSFEHPIVGEIVIIKPNKYIWRTRGDDKVRQTHAARNGRIFDFNNPPAGGNPGDEHGCRCWAEPVPLQSLKQIFQK